MYTFTIGISLVATIFCGAIFGFFYAWICSTMWGLDAADPRIAITAMQAMNASVRNAAFAPAFFGTPVVLALAAAACFLSGCRRAALAFLSAAVVYAVGGMMLTFQVNVPMNRALAALAVPEDPAAAAALWQDYSAPWQVWNLVRTVFSGVALMLAAAGLLLLGREASKRKRADLAIRPS